MINSVEKIVKDLFEGIRGLPDIFRRPKALWGWVLRNPGLPLTAVALLAVVPLVLPVTDFALGKIYHPVAKKQLFGLVNTMEDDARLDVRKAQVRWLLWFFACAASSSIILLQVPKARKEALWADDAADNPDGTVVEKHSSLTAVGPDGRYLLGDEIGRGAMGIIYSATDRVLDREVALKELPVHLADDPDRYKRFQREARILARLAHPGILQVFDLLEEAGRHFFVMELVDGGDLKEHVDRDGSFTMERVCLLGVPIIDALNYLHGQGIIHRDLKPANILLTRDGQPKISDFGMARWIHDSGLTMEGSILGSPNYMSPEQAAGKELDYRSDFYSLGVLFYWLFTGETPFDGDVQSVLSQHLTQTPDPPSSRNSDIPDDVERVILSLMEKDPKVREQDLVEVEKVLSAYTKKG